MQEPTVILHGFMKTESRLDSQDPNTWTNLLESKICLSKILVKSARKKYLYTFKKENLCI